MAKLTESALRAMIRKELKMTLKESYPSNMPVGARAALIEMDDMDEVLSDFTEVETTPREIVGYLVGRDIQPTMSDSDQRAVWGKFYKYIKDLNYTLKQLPNNKIIIMAPVYGGKEPGSDFF